MTWDYSIYPELSETKINTFKVAGEKIYLFQIAEHMVQNCMIFVFEEPDFLLENFYSIETKVKSKTLGRIIANLRSKAEIDPGFDNILTTFVEKRNFFVHKIFSDKEYGLANDELCRKTEIFLNELQDYAWTVMNVFLGCMVEWSKISGIHEQMDFIHDNKHFTQLEQKKYHLLIKSTRKI